MPWRPIRVGMAQSNVSMPSSTPRTRSSTSPMPSRWTGRSTGSSSIAQPDDLEHLVLVLAQRAADGDAERAPGGHLLGGRAAQVLLHPALDDPVDDLALRAVLGVPGQAAVEPAVRALGRARGVVAAAVERRALVEHERDVRAQRRLDRHRRLRAHEALRAVEVGAEAHALLGDRDDAAGPVAARLRGAALDLVGHRAVAHREHLEAAGVGDHRAVPAHEPVQAALTGDQLVPRREEEVERVAEHHVEAELGGLAHLERLDDGLGGERDERRRAHVAVSEAQRARAGARAGVRGVDLEAGHGGRQASAAPRRRRYAASASMVFWPPRPIVTLRGLRCSGLGMRTSSTPRSNVAATASASTPSGSVSARENGPNARSTRW